MTPNDEAQKIMRQIAEALQAKNIVATVPLLQKLALADPDMAELIYEAIKEGARA